MTISNSLIQAHQQAGRFFTADGVKSFMRDTGQGEAVVCMHGVPSSSFLYRKILPALAESGFRGISFDLPGLGLSDRPDDFDYSWTGLGKWSVQATEALGLDKFHLVIHDVGGPVGLEMLAAYPERILSLTILNTLIVNVGTFKKPMVMRPFEWKGAGELYLKTLVPALFQQLMYVQGVQDKSAFGFQEAQAYTQLLKYQDNGKAFLKIMRSFEPTPVKEQLYTKVIQKLTVPKQVVWGAKDTALTLKDFGYPIRDVLNIKRFFEINGKHFLQEDCAEEIVEKIVEMNRPQISMKY
ncbi:MAG: alpha/beta fold hydrolase [Saprospiraceae bacterium]